MTRVLVTGTNTPVGRRVVELLLHDPETEVVVAVGNAPTFPDFSDERLHYQSCDLTHSREIKNLMFGSAKEHAVHTLVHTSFHRNVSARGRRVHALNVESTRTLLELAERHSSIRHLIYQSSIDAYLIQPGRTVMLREDHPLDFSSHSIQSVRDRVESDIIVCTKMGVSPLRIQVLRCAEVLDFDTGSQVYDYLQSRVCYRPIGFDPMLNLLTVEDAARALVLSIENETQGVFNIAGFDTLPLSLVIRKWGRFDIPVPGPLLAPIYRWRQKARGTEFRYDFNIRRFHFSTVMDGTKALRELGYAPEHAIHWPFGQPGVPRMQG